MSATPQLDLSKVNKAPSSQTERVKRSGPSLGELDEKTLQVLLKRNFFTPRQQLQLFGKNGSFHTTNEAKYGRPGKEYYNSSGGAKERFVEGVYSDKMDYTMMKPETAFGVDVFAKEKPGKGLSGRVHDTSKLLEYRVREQKGTRKPTPPPRQPSASDFVAGNKTVREDKYNIITAGAETAEKGDEYATMYKSTFKEGASNTLPKRDSLRSAGGPMFRTSIDLRHMAGDDDSDHFKTTKAIDLQSPALSPHRRHGRFDARHHGAAKVGRILRKHKGEQVSSKERFLTTKESFQSIISEDLLRRQVEDSSDKGFQRSRYDTMVSGDAPPWFQLANVKRGRMGASQMLVGKDGNILSINEARRELADLKNREDELRSYCHATQVRETIGRQLRTEDMEAVQKLNGKWVLQPISYAPSASTTPRKNAITDGPERIRQELGIPQKGRRPDSGAYVPGLAPFAHA